MELAGRLPITMELAGRLPSDGIHFVAISPFENLPSIHHHHGAGWALTITMELAGRLHCFTAHECMGKGEFALERKNF